MHILYQERSSVTAYPAYIIGLLFVLCLGPAQGAAKPVGRHVRRASDNGGGTISPKIWIPVLLGALILSGAAMMKWSRKALSRGLASIGEAAAIATGTASASSTTPRVHEVTAEQLAGRTGTTAPQARRAGRRARRTPSQISTKSLPVYMKEPGEQELVIFRGQDPEESVDVATTVIMPSLAEDAEGQARSRDVSRTSLYGNLPDSPQNMSLIHGDESFDPSTDVSTRHLLPANSRQSAFRGSFDTMQGSEESASSLLRAVQQAGDDSVVGDPRGDAPPYFEAVNNRINGSPLSWQGINHANRTSESTAFPQVSTLGARADTVIQARASHSSRRLSGFRSMLHTLTNSTARPAIPPIPQEPSVDAPGHIRANSSLSATSLPSQEIHQTRERGASRASHRPSHSNSSSMMQTALRTLSRQKSHQTLNSSHFNSPSMISLNSISAPLTHTLTRTEISYPASGPTADQMRLISSRESFARFGVPYGPDAIAYAASTSRHDLEPPPDFESHVASSAPATRSSPLVGESSTPPVETRPATRDSSLSLDTQNVSLQDVESIQDTEHNVEQHPGDGRSSPVVKSPSQLHDGQSSPSTPIPPAPPTITHQVSPKTSSVPPPSAFRASPTPVAPMRPESRASSMISAMSYITAEESIYDSATSGTRTPESPSTPRRTSLNMYENTDVTISQRITPATAQFTA